MKSVVRNLRAAIEDPQDYTARSNLMWDATMAENRMIKMGKRCDFQCHNMEHQLSAFTDCNHGCGLVVLHPVYYRHIYKRGLVKICPFCKKCMGNCSGGKTEEELALAGIQAPGKFYSRNWSASTLKDWM